MNFWKAFFASCLGTLVALICGASSWYPLLSLSGGDEVEVKESSILRLDLDAPIIETEKERSVCLFLAG